MDEKRLEDGRSYKVMMRIASKEWKEEMSLDQKKPYRDKFTDLQEEFTALKSEYKKRHHDLKLSKKRKRDNNENADENDI